MDCGGPTCKGLVWTRLARQTAYFTALVGALKLVSVVWSGAACQMAFYRVLGVNVCFFIFKISCVGTHHEIFC